MSNGKGCLSLDRRDGVWSFFWREGGKQKSKRLGKFKSQAAAWTAARPYRHRLENMAPSKPQPATITVSQLIERYRVEKMPARFSTRQGYESWLRNRILPKWGSVPVAAIEAYPVEQWLTTLALSPKSKVEIRSIIRRLLDFAMLVKIIPTARNEMELVTVKNASKRTRKPRSLTEAEFQTFISHLAEPFRTMALLGITSGLRISETLGLKWSDVNWLENKLTVERGVVKNRVDSTKTEESEQEMTIDAGMLEVVKQWKQSTQFSDSEDWMFASPAAIGRLPWSYDQVWRAFLNAGKASGIGKVGTHSMRHSYRSWLDAAKTPIATQQKLMRHRDIRTTMNVYGTVVTDEMTVAGSKVEAKALPNCYGTATDAT